jgi:hypothetical protein
MQPSSDSLRVVRLTKQTMPFHVYTGDKCQSEPFPCVGIPSIPRSSHPHDCRAEITIVRTCHELVLTAKTNDAIRVDYASYWSVTYSSLSPPISICILRVSLLLFLYLFCTIFYAFSGASPIDPRNLVDLPHSRLSTHLLYARRLIPSYLYLFPSPAIKPYLREHDRAAWRRTSSGSNTGHCLVDFFTSRVACIYGGRNAYAADIYLDSAHLSPYDI